MPGGAIDYSLGLATRGFLGPLTVAQGALAAFTGFAVGAGGVLAGVFASIERGGQLVDLRSRTGENIASLVQLQEGFKAVGLDAGTVSTVVFQLQKALSGVSEAGESTVGAFTAIGLQTKQLRGQDTVGQLTAIAKGLSGLGAADAAGIAAKLFSRGAAGDVIQLSRDLGGFLEAVRAVEPVAQAFRRFSGTFDELGDKLALVRTLASGFFVEIAGGLAPALLKVVDAIRSLDVQAFGAKIGSAFRALTAAFERGQVTELVSLSLAAGFEKAVDVLQRSLAAVFAALPELVSGSLASAFKSIGLALVGAIGQPLADLFEGMANSKFLGISPDSPVGRSLRQQAAAFRILGDVAKDEAPKVFQEAVQRFFGAARTGIGAFGEGVQGPASKRLQEFLATIPGILEGDQAKKNGDAKTAGIFGGTKETADALTRIGFFSGGDNELTQISRQIAGNTRESAKQLARIAARMERGGSVDFANV